MEKNFTAKEIRAAFKLWQKGKISDKELLIYYESVWDQKLWKLFDYMVSESNMPKNVQGSMLVRDDADELIKRYAEKAEEDEQIYDGNGELVLKNKRAENAIIPLLEKFYLSKNDEEVLFEPANRLRAKEYVAFYEQQWGLCPKLKKKAKKLGWI